MPLSRALLVLPWICFHTPVSATTYEKAALYQDDAFASDPLKVHYKLGPLCRFEQAFEDLPSAQVMYIDVQKSYKTDPHYLPWLISKFDDIWASLFHTPYTLSDRYVYIMLGVLAGHKLHPSILGFGPLTFAWHRASAFFQVDPEELVKSFRKTFRDVKMIKFRSSSGRMVKLTHKPPDSFQFGELCRCFETNAVFVDVTDLYQ